VSTRTVLNSSFLVVELISMLSFRGAGVVC